MPMRRWLAMIVCAVFFLSLGCGGGDKGKNKDKDVPRPAEPAAR